MRLFSKASLGLACASALLMSNNNNNNNNNIFVSGNSAGLNIPCDVDNALLGTLTRTKPTTEPFHPMWWSTPPTWADTKYTLRTSESATASSDPTTYVPGEYTELFLKVGVLDKQHTGLLMYAENSAGQKVGQWLVPPRQAYQVDPKSNCVTHSNADPKNYRAVFRVMLPKGTGTVKIKALVKYGLAFPELSSGFYWPNNAHIVLTEAAENKPAVQWIQGNVGESCNSVCAKKSLGCDLATLKSVGTSDSMLSTIKKTTNCTLPLLRGCSSSSPAVGTEGCFYHDDSCTRGDQSPNWVQTDPCAVTGINDFTSSVNYDKAYCKYGGFKWFAKYYTNSVPVVTDYGSWLKVGVCASSMPYPVSSLPTSYPSQSKTAVDCTSSKATEEDGGRLCACSSGSPVAPTDAPATKPPVSPTTASVVSPTSASTTQSTATATTRAPTTAATPTTVRPTVAPVCTPACGPNGLCSFNNACICKNNYGGAQCTVAPPVTCTTVNCPAQNRATCTSDNVCGACLTGFMTLGANCVIQCPTTCSSLKRTGCAVANTCGPCQTGFIEPSSNLRSDSCVAPTSPPTRSPTTPSPTTKAATGSSSAPASTAAPATTSTPTASVLSLQFKVSASWQTGFCTEVSGIVPSSTVSRDFALTLAPYIKLTQQWNLNLVVAASGVDASASAPSWAQIGQRWSGGACFELTQSGLVAVATATGFTVLKRTAQSASTLAAYSEFDVILRVNLNRIPFVTVSKDSTFADTLSSEVAALLDIDVSLVSVVSFSDSGDGNTAVVIKIVSATFDGIPLAASIVSKSAAIPVSSSVYVYVTKFEQSSVQFEFPTQAYTDNSGTPMDVSPTPATSTTTTDVATTETSSKKSMVPIIVGVVLGVIVLVAVIAVAVFLVSKKSAATTNNNSHIASGVQMKV